MNLWTDLLKFYLVACVLTLFLGMHITGTPLKPNRALLVLALRCAGIAALFEALMSAGTCLIWGTFFGLQKLGASEDAALVVVIGMMGAILIAQQGFRRKGA